MYGGSLPRCSHPGFDSSLWPLAACHPLSLSALFPVKLLLNNSGDDGSQDIIA